MPTTQDIPDPGSIAITAAQAHAIACLTVDAVTATVRGQALAGRAVRLDVWHSSLDDTPAVYVIGAEGVVSTHDRVHLDAMEMRR